MINVKCVYSAPFMHSDASDYMCKHPPYMPSYFGIYGIYTQFDGHVCFWQYLAVTCEVYIAVGCVLVFALRSVFQSSILAV